MEYHIYSGELLLARTGTFEDALFYKLIHDCASVSGQTTRIEEVR